MNAKDLGAMPASPCDFGACQPSYGLTKREAFAMAAMQGALANSELDATNGFTYASAIISSAVILADALLAELVKE